jgi:hypothetical protein
MLHSDINEPYDVLISEDKIISRLRKLEEKVDRIKATQERDIADQWRVIADLQDRIKKFVEGVKNV